MEAEVGLDPMMKGPDPFFGQSRFAAGSCATRQSMTSVGFVDPVGPRDSLRVEDRFHRLKQAAICLLVALLVCQSIPLAFLVAQDAKSGSQPPPGKSQSPPGKSQPPPGKSQPPPGKS